MKNRDQKLKRKDPSGIRCCQVVVKTSALSSQKSSNPSRSEGKVRSGRVHMLIPSVVKSFGHEKEKKGSTRYLDRARALNSQKTLLSLSHSLSPPPSLLYSRFVSVHESSVTSDGEA